MHLHQNNKLPQAKQVYQRLLTSQPDHPELLNLLGNVQQDLGEFDAAIANYNIALQHAPHYAEAYANRADALQELKEFKLAIDSYAQAIRLEPNNPDNYYNQGVAFSALELFSNALDCYVAAIKLDPNCAEFHFNHGNTLKNLNLFDQAITSYNQAILLKPKYAEAYLNRAAALQSLKQFDHAIDSLQQAIQIKPDFAEAYNQLGIVLKDTQKFDSALAAFQMALSFKKNYSNAHYNIGCIHDSLGNYEHALTSYEKAIDAQPNHADAHWNKSLALLLNNHYLDGWSEYEWRWERSKFPSPKRTFNQPLWLGKSAIQGKTILLHAEQGLGDTIQFCRYIHLIKELGANVILEVQKPLLGLMQSLSRVDLVIAQGTTIPHFDLHCPLMSLPFAFNTTLETIPSSIPYLFSNQQQVTQWRAYLGKQQFPRIGLAWSGNSNHPNDNIRSMSLTELIAQLPNGFEYISLQQEIRPIDLQTLSAHPHIRHFGDLITDFSDTAALCGLVDLVISVDTSVAHLAGAIGKPVWVLIPRHPDWRWLLKRADSPWYPTARLFRATSPNNWQSVLNDVNLSIKNLFPNTTL